MRPFQMFRLRPKTLSRSRLGLTQAVCADALLYTTDAMPDFAVIDKIALRTEEWPIRVWQSAQWQYARLRQFPANIVPPTGYRDWAKLVPDVVSLRDYVNGGYLENGPVRRYANLEQLNADLRERGRGALVGYLSSLNRCRFSQAAGALPFALSARDLAERLLLDVETGSCGATPRIEEASAAVRMLVQRLRFGLEAMSPDDISRAFLETWDLHFAEYRRWQAWRYQDVYPENYREADLIRIAGKTEAFQFLERQLPELALTVDEEWDDLTPPLLPSIPGLIRWNDRLPSMAGALSSQPQGYRNLNERERAEHRTALSGAPVVKSVSFRETNSIRLQTKSPLEMDRRFVRVQFTTTAWQDDFYFWLVDGAAYDQTKQDAAWEWEQEINREDYLAGIPSGLLAWKSRKTVRLAWCRVRDSIEHDVRISDYGIPVGEPDVQLAFEKRDGDLLIFQVVGATDPAQRLVYNPGENLVHILSVWTIGPAPASGRLPSFPHFIAVAAGAPAGPVTFHAPVLLVQKHLRLHDRPDAARTWLEFLYKPLARSNGWEDLNGVAGRPNARTLLLNWIETVLEIGESQLSRNRTSTTELSRETLALVRKVLGGAPRRILHRVGTGPVDLAALDPKRSKEAPSTGGWFHCGLEPTDLRRKYSVARTAGRSAMRVRNRNSSRRPVRFLPMVMIG
ncbi:neuraminidase-like domain-containing protein [Rhizobium beringeri]|nr:neuraminidase-like domain-containing protein [Rhizobium beringeri]WSH16676.1 neuraminidase-like domain-containing protein [Rhizobium beringeri]